MPKRGQKAEQVEAALLDQLQRIERRIKKLSDEHAALKSTLAAHRIQHLSFKGAIRKNSFSRLIVEKRVVDYLKTRSGPVESYRLYSEVNKGHEDSPMAATTFRSHLYRMKSEGLIISGPSRGSYLLPKIGR